MTSTVPALAISIGFIVVVFYIIAAPAIAFRPTSRLVEFLAKHGDYAGLWLLAPTLLAGLAIPNVKLQAVLATAMAIELTWFLRQRWANRRRQLYPLDDRDLLVLETQAKGNLVAYRRHHGIRELVLSKGAVSWKGCGKRTPPCPSISTSTVLASTPRPAVANTCGKSVIMSPTCLRDIGARATGWRAAAC